ncbi:hypothetical protein GE09DRAFT_1154313 [Coniochaeta sp. 2T2.1]|nr:hypothetical protein GE09DRAFT_1154313 [Coniochaeta sp. 2T2.1]
MHLTSVLVTIFALTAQVAVSTHTLHSSAGRQQPYESPPIKHQTTNASLITARLRHPRRPGARRLRSPHPRRRHRAARPHRRPPHQHSRELHHPRSRHLLSHRRGGLEGRLLPGGGQPGPRPPHHGHGQCRPRRPLRRRAGGAQRRKRLRHLGVRRGLLLPQPGVHDRRRFALLRGGARGHVAHGLAGVRVVQARDDEEVGRQGSPTVLGGVWVRVVLHGEGTQFLQRGGQWRRDPGLGLIQAFFCSCCWFVQQAQELPFTQKYKPPSQLLSNNNHRVPPMPGHRRSQVWRAVQNPFKLTSLWIFPQTALGFGRETEKSNDNTNISKSYHSASTRVIGSSSSIARMILPFLRAPSRYLHTKAMEW